MYTFQSIENIVSFFLYFHKSELYSKHISKHLFTVPALSCDLFWKYTI